MKRDVASLELTQSSLRYLQQRQVILNFFRRFRSLSLLLSSAYQGQASHSSGASAIRTSSLSSRSRSSAASQEERHGSL